MREFSDLFHLALHVSDLNKSIEFYGKLGCEHVFTLKLPDGRDWLAYVRVAKDQYLELFQIYPDHPLTPRDKITHADTDNFGHLSFLVPDIYETAKSWAANGVRILYSPMKPVPVPLEDSREATSQEGADKNYILWVADPDGNWIEVMQELDDSWQKVYEERHPI